MGSRPSAHRSSPWLQPCMCDSKLCRTVEKFYSAKILASDNLVTGNLYSVLTGTLNNHSHSVTLWKKNHLIHLSCGTAVIRAAVCVRVRACRLFRDGRITWGRVLTLLCFGYRIAVTVIQRGIRGFFSNVVGFVVRFVFTEKIARWIAEQGGWVRCRVRFHLADDVRWCCSSVIESTLSVRAPCGLRGWKNRPAPFPGRMS